jgi:peptidoglycan/xylan/chitin deacetylase (PgdA/CDA1 family)
MKMVYLTVDDAPSRGFIQKVDFLKQKRIPAMFFCIGKLMEDHRDEIAYATRQGAIIANHSWSHRDFGGISFDEAREEIEKTDEVIDEIYREAHTERRIRSFRFPYGSKGVENKDKLQNLLREMGYRQPAFEAIRYDWFSGNGLSTDRDVFWTFDVAEYELGWEEIMESINSRCPKQGGSLVDESSSDILLMHDHTKTTGLFIRVIDEFLSRDIQFQEMV